MAEPIDTSKLGAIKHDPMSRDRRAVVVREALEQAARSERDLDVAKALLIVARRGDTETLLYIGRLLKA